MRVDSCRASETGMNPINPVSAIVFEVISQSSKKLCIYIVNILYFVCEL